MRQQSRITSVLLYRERENILHGVHTQVALSWLLIFVGTSCEQAKFVGDIRRDFSFLRNDTLKIPRREIDHWRA